MAISSRSSLDDVADCRNSSIASIFPVSQYVVNSFGCRERCSAHFSAIPTVSELESYDDREDFSPENFETGANELDGEICNVDFLRAG